MDEPLILAKIGGGLADFNIHSIQYAIANQMGLGGRASQLFLHPITFIELGERRTKTWTRCLTLGGLPQVLTSSDPFADLKDYVGLYLREEVQAEGLTRSIENFSRFLDVAALCQCEQVNFTKIGSDAQVPPRTIIDYFSILEDTLVGALLPAFTETTKRKAMTTAKFYFFDVGVGNTLANRPDPKPGSSDFGKSFEHYIYTQLRAFIDYRRRGAQLQFWRSTTKFEVDFVVRIDPKTVIAIEVKSNSNPTARDWKGILALSEELKIERKIVVTLGASRRQTQDGIEILPAVEFLEDLWAGQIF